jgi:hypothetical protein
MAVVSDNLDAVLADIIRDAETQVSDLFGEFITDIIRDEIEGTWDSEYPIEVKKETGDKTTVHWGDDSRKNGIPFILNWGVPEGNVKWSLNRFKPKTTPGKLRSVEGFWERGNYHPEGVPGAYIEARQFDEGMVKRADQQFAQYAEANLKL